MKRLETDSNRLKKFLMITGVVLSFSCSIYVLIASIKKIPISDIFVWVFTGAALLYIFIALAIRIYLFKKEKKSLTQTNPFVLTLYIIVGLLAISLIYARLHLYNIPKGDSLYEEFKKSEKTPKNY